LYEKGVVHHVGEFVHLEEEMTTWVPGDKSPNRVDALVWGITELMFMEDEFGIIIPRENFLA
jgi:phage terminase large subunit-like protein